MVTRFRLNTLAQLIVVLALAFGLKSYYSTARVDELKWILTPTTRLVEFVSGRTFEFESRAGYMGSDHTFLIAASCAGVNFLITAFLMLSLSRLWSRPRSAEECGVNGWSVVPISAFAAYAATVVANTVRISVALQLRQGSLKTNVLNGDQLHRLEGIFVYFGFLLLLFLCSENLYRTRRRELGNQSFLRSSRYVFPLMIYYCTTLGLPLMNGAYSRAKDFGEHSVFVIITPLVLIVSVQAVRMLARLFSSEKRLAQTQA
jgi:exosortase K